LFTFWVTIIEYKINKRREIVVNKSIIKKGLLIVVLITLLSIVFVGCTLILPPTTTTGTVNISVVSGILLGKLIIPIDSTYDIHMDGIYIDTTNNSGNLTMVSVPVGWHTFEAFSNFGSGYGSTGKYMSTGINNVTIPVPPFII
jgi:hypothetical protein